MKVERYNEKMDSGGLDFITRSQKAKSLAISCMEITALMTRGDTREGRRGATLMTRGDTREGWHYEKFLPSPPKMSLQATVI